MLAPTLAVTSICLLCRVPESPRTSALKPGVLRVRLAGSDRVYATGRGYTEVKDNRVVILVENAIAKAEAIGKEGG